MKNLALLVDLTFTDPKNQMNTESFTNRNWEQNSDQKNSQSYAMRFSNLPHTPLTLLLTNPKTADQSKTYAVILYLKALDSGLDFQKL